MDGWLRNQVISSELYKKKKRKENGHFIRSIHIIHNSFIGWGTTKIEKTKIMKGTAAETTSFLARRHKTNGTYLSEQATHGFDV